MTDAATLPQGFVAAEPLANLPPPPGVIPGRLARLRRTYFGSVPNAVVTILCLILLALAARHLADWFVLKAVWTGSAQDCRVAGAGACWAFIGEKFWFSVFGLYPYELRWRPSLVLALFLGLVAVSVQRRFWRRELLLAWIAGMAAMSSLMGGSFLGWPIPGLSLVPTRLWGGVFVTIFLAIFGVAIAYPVGILLALGRRSRLPVINAFCVAWIEFIRGVPLISVLFIATFIVPLFMPSGVEIDRLLRAQIAFVVFAAAYLAEVFRGGLQAVPKGQFEAADSLGLGYWRATRLIILPQALKITIPAQVNIFIGMFKDTTLVVIIGLFDFFTTLRASLGDPNWLGFATEAYVYAALVYFVICYCMSRYSRRLEDTLNPERFR
jgi:general L-amino acid transport system permease protein